VISNAVTAMVVITARLAQMYVRARNDVNMMNERAFPQGAPHGAHGEQERWMTKPSARSAGACHVWDTQRYLNTVQPP
jgi:hypothetical protein